MEQNEKTGANSPGYRDRKMGNIGTASESNPVTAHGIFNNNDIKIGLSRSNGRYIEIEDRKEAIRYCIENADPGDMIVLLGKGHENYQEVKGIKYRFDEREVIAEIKEELGL